MISPIDYIILGESRLPVDAISRRQYGDEPIYLVCSRGRGGSLGFVVARDTGRLSDHDAYRLAEWYGVTTAEVRNEVERVVREHAAAATS